MELIKQRLNKIQHNISRYSEQYKRSPDTITLIAVSKTWSAQHITYCHQQGQKHFGESYLQEAIPKIKELAHQKIYADIVWHYLGRLQSNKTRLIACHFHWVHSIDRSKLITLLNKHRPDDLPPLNICLQININKDAGKGGIAPEDLPRLAAEIAQYPRLKLRGIMAIPEKLDGFTAQHRQFEQIKALYDNLATEGYELDCLSMGMSHDYEAAIAAGATHLRIGTGIFGPRDNAATAVK